MAESHTGFSDTFYNVISVQYHALKGSQVYATYIQDARSAGESEVADFFEQVQKEDAERAQRCHNLLEKLS
jgi:rubrerythrin